MQARGSTFALKSTADHLRCHRNSKTGVSMAPQKRTYILQIVLKK